MKGLVVALGWLAVGVGWLVGAVGVVLTATGFFAIVGLPLLGVAVVLVASGMGVTSPVEELVARVPARIRPLVVSVVGVHGGCPRGLRLGDSWRITDGAVPELCRPALTAITSLTGPSLPSGQTSASCHCPFGNYGLTFAVKAA